MNEDDAKSLIIKLLERYCSCQILSNLQLGIDSCQPVFVDDMWWHTIYIESDGILESPVLKGKDAADVVQQMYSAFEHGCWLSSVLHGGKHIDVKLDDGTGAVEEFMMKCVLEGIA